MFILESAISAWRSQMLAAGIQTPVPLEELELHLCDEIARLMEGGADSQTAFETATQKIGGPAMLKDEFSKIQPSRLKKFIPIFLPLLASVFALWVALALLLGLGNFGELTSAQRVSGLVALAFPLLLSWGGWFGYRAFLRLPVKRARLIIGAACCLLMLWWAAFFFLVLEKSEFTIAQLNVAFLWGFIAPVGFVVGLSAGVERAIRRADGSTKIGPPDSPSSPNDARKNSRRWLMFVCLLLAASLACLGIGSHADANGFCVIACLLLSLVLPLAAGLLPAIPPSQTRRWIRIMLAGQISLGICGAVIIFSPLRPLWGLSLAVLSCAVFAHHLWQQSRQTISHA